MTQKLQIVSISNGSNWRWVFIGLVEKTAEGIAISDAKCIRRWGTTKGLGQLASEGPQRNTVIDEGGAIAVPSHAIEFTIDVTNLAAWSSHFPSVNGAIDHSQTEAA